MAVFCMFRIFASAKFFIILPDNHTAHAREIKQLIAFYGFLFTGAFSSGSCAFPYGKVKKAHGAGHIRWRAPFLLPPRRLEVGGK